MQTIWKIPGDVEHLVELEHDLETDRKTLRVHGAEVPGEQVSRTVTKFSFSVGGVPAIVWVSPGLRFPRASLRVGALEVKPSSTDVPEWLRAITVVAWVISSVVTLWFVSQT